MSGPDAAQRFLKRWFWISTHSRLKPIQDLRWNFKYCWFEYLKWCSLSFEWFSSDP